MSWITKLFGTDVKLTEDEILEVGVCPNCWGKQEYNGKFKQYVEDKTKSNVNHDSTGRKAFIQQFVEDHVDGIRLKNENGKRSCKSCTLDH